jgi:hypothetical protein
VWLASLAVRSPRAREETALRRRQARPSRCVSSRALRGGVGFRLTGPARFTFDGAQAAAAAKRVGARTIVPVHYDGWTHFLEGRAGAEAAFAEAGIAHRVRWLVPGEPTELEV